VTRPLSLAHLTILEASPPNMVEIAAASGFQAVGLRLRSPRPDVPSPPMIGDTPMRRETCRRLADTGIRVFDIETIVLTPDMTAKSYLPLLDAGAALGAGCAVVVGFDPDEARGTAVLAEIAELSHPLGISLALEFMAYSAVRSLAQAVRIVRNTGAANVGIMLDVLHLQRTGTTAADVSGVEPRLLRAMQLCDGRASVEEREMIEESRSDRAFLGEGEFPLAAWLASVPGDLPLAIEIPAERLRRQGVPPLERARLARRSFDRVFGRH